MLDSLLTGLLMPASVGNVDPTAVSRSARWKYWFSIADPRRCPDCESMHGKVYESGEPCIPSPPEHFNCRCEILRMLCIMAGYATTEGNNGADWWLKNVGRLPEYYITKAELEELGWRYGKAPARYAPSRMATMGEYYNRNGHLPSANGRTWYEADINYHRGTRNSQRILWSNDGLIFVTYDHYETFIEIH